MALRDAKPQHKILLGNGRQHFTGKDDGTDRVGHIQHATGRRRHHLAFGKLPLNDRALGNTRAMSVFRDTDGCARFIKPRPRRRPTFEQTFCARKIGSRLRELSLETGDLGIERGKLDGELFITDCRDDLTGRDFVPFFHRELRDRSAGTDPRRYRFWGLDRRKDRLVIRDRADRDIERIGSVRRLPSG